VDLVSSGETLRANRLKQIKGGSILKSQAVFIGNRSDLENPEVLELAREFLEYFEAFLRGRKFVQVFANVREPNADVLSQKLFNLPQLTGLQGPTISPIFTRNGNNWNAVHIIVERTKLQDVIQGLRSIGGSGVIVSPTLYIFEEEPECYKELLFELNGEVNDK
jgi:ATP phosphoribosyltransferase